MHVLDLFSGTGGFSLGLERAGMRTVAFCEADPFCREWLAQQWPEVPCFPDVRALDGRTVGPVDLVCGGFPCQDVSAAGKGAGLDGARSGLWFEMHRVVREVRPAWVVAENVTALRTRGADRVLADLEASNYAAWPFVVGADDVGLPHRRKRAWIIGRRMADADGDAVRILEQWLPGRRSSGVRDERETVARCDGALADSDRGRCESERLAHDGELKRAPGDLADGCGRAWDLDSRHGGPQSMGDADGARLERHARAGIVQRRARLLRPAAATGVRRPAAPGEQQHEWEAARTVTVAQCRLGVSVDGLPARMGPTLNRARLKAAGNAIVPHVAEIIGRAILRIEEAVGNG